jgi:hypothetical protein
MLTHGTVFKILDFLCIITLVFACNVIKVYNIVKFEVLVVMLTECNHLGWYTV